MEQPASTRCGHVALAGAPNVGKSSLLNALIGEHLAIVSPKPQATRLPVVGLRTEADTQYIFHDLPGLLDPKYLLQERMQRAAHLALERAHVILHVMPANQPRTKDLASLLGIETSLPAPVLTVYTKGDLVSAERRQELANEGWVVSAVLRKGLEPLLARIRDLLPFAPFEFDPDDVGVQPLRFFVVEYLREAAFELLGDELPYSFAAEVEEFRENAKPVYIRVNLFVERESQKGILIGHQGSTLRALGAHARTMLERLVGEQVYLDCWVKVLPNWRRSSAALARLGFPDTER